MQDIPTGTEYFFPEKKEPVLPQVLFLAGLAFSAIVALVAFA